MFNSQARWDRPLPQADNLPGEPINAIISFKKGKIFPLCFFLHEDKHIIKKIEFTWQKKQGREIFYLFSVTDIDKNCYTLCFNRQNLNWYLLFEE